MDFNMLVCGALCALCYPSHLMVTVWRQFMESEGQKVTENELKPPINIEHATGDKHPSSAARRLCKHCQVVVWTDPH